MSLPNYPNTPADGQEYTLPSGVVMRWDASTGVWRVLTNADASFRLELAAIGSTVLVGGVEAGKLIARVGTGAPTWESGAGSPEGVVTAVVGSMYTRTDGGAGTTLYIKESGTGATGWVAK